MGRSDLVVAACLVSVVVVHLLPLAGVAGPGQLDDFYGIGAVSGDTSTSELHRVVVIDIAAIGMLTVAAR